MELDSEAVRAQLESRMAGLAGCPVCGGKFNIEGEVKE
jgi:hypothetical protein